MVGPHWAPDPPAKDGNDYKKCIHAEGRRACVGHLAQSSGPQTVSENETYDPLKSGPAKAGPAGLATPPLLYICI